MTATRKGASWPTQNTCGGWLDRCACGRLEDHRPEIGSDTCGGEYFDEAVALDTFIAVVAATLIAVFYLTVNEQQPPWEGCRAASETEYKSAHVEAFGEPGAARAV